MKILREDDKLIIQNPVTKMKYTLPLKIIRKNLIKLIVPHAIAAKG